MRFLSWLASIAVSVVELATMFVEKFRPRINFLGKSRDGSMGLVYLAT